ncbi:transcriptional regulator family: C2H2 zinc finger [Penicillium lagena]|uniref:transcriptional regulator family: C2H2 zinc finger n=1 Tax=Penicillium lagena TaxID=94218 RepID=UPI00253FE2C1|nr:transcriptional regulator family: C2H2 zinc finger [Penicillium lagena]KAJ5612091.1 transcriptional regulator family: C2H2 zinc finger [Penicillium lagena]
MHVSRIRWPPSGGLSEGRDWTLGHSYAAATGHLSHPPSLGESPDLFTVRDPSANLATLAAPGMSTALDALAAQPLNARRAGAPTLPSFELPPPPFNLAATSKYPSQPSQPASQAPASVGNLLTPPATNQSGESATPSHTLAPSTGGSSDLPSYWSNPNLYAAGPPHAQAWAHSVYPARSSFSPQSGLVGRASSITSPPTTDGLSTHEMPSMSSFPQPLPAPSSTMSHMAGGIYPPATSPPSLSSNDPYAPHKAQSIPSAGQPHIGFPRQPWPSYSLPAMNGPIMTNVHSPNTPMSMMGGMQAGMLPGFNSGHVANSQHMYGAHQPPHGMPAPAADRPFKCDQCPQSFNRNHDLKRHKRIHLAVKPFPCKHCDKSFSRKDALKRHILVKGCGKDETDDRNLSGAADESVKSSGLSEDGSPVMNGHV